MLRAAARWFIRQVFAEVRSLPTDQLAEWLADPVRPQPLLLDIRLPAEFGVSHMAQARRADSDSLAENVLAGVPAEQPIVCYCAAGWRSAIMAKKLARAGRDEVFNLEGGIFNWVSEGRPLECGGQPTRVVHPFNWFGRLMLPPGASARVPQLRH